ncbi:MAG: hypothetical protein AAF429_14455 [Pseudomonadota bacterium]
MALPLIPVIVVAGVGAVSLGGYQFGRKVGEGVGKTVPLLLLTAAAFTVYKALDK